MPKEELQEHMEELKSALKKNRTTNAVDLAAARTAIENKIGIMNVRLNVLTDSVIEFRERLTRIESKIDTLSTK